MPLYVKKKIRLPGIVRGLCHKTNDIKKIGRPLDDKVECFREQ